MSRHADVLIVGGAVGGVRTAEALRRFGFDGTVTILEASDDLPYDRPALSKQVLTHAVDASAVRLRSREDLAASRIEWCGRARATGLDTRAATVRLEDGTEVTYGSLVLATGSSPRRLPGVPASPAVHYLRTLDDAIALRQQLVSARRLVVVGAGFIGSEVAAAASTTVPSVTVVEPMAQPLGRVLGDVVGRRLARLHTAHGVTLVLGRSVEAIHQGEDGEVAVVLDDDAILDGDAVVVGIGAVPRTDWLDGSGLDVDDGIVLDEYCRAGAPGVYAVGDVARWLHPMYREPVRVEHWTNATEQATTVAWNILHPEALRPHEPVPYVWSDQYGSRLQIVGRPRTDDEVRVIRDDGHGMVALYVRNGALVGAFAMDAPRQALALRRALASRATLDDVMDDLLSAA